MVTDDHHSIEDGKFDSQDLLGRYEEGYMTEEDDKE